MKSKKQKSKKKIKITPTVVIGLIIGLAIIGTGFYTVFSYDEYAGYYGVGLGVCFIILTLSIFFLNR